MNKTERCKEELRYPNTIRYEGVKFGDWVVVMHVSKRSMGKPNIHNHGAVWLLKCLKCGSERLARSCQLKKGKLRRCETCIPKQVTRLEMLESRVSVLEQMIDNQNNPTSGERT